MPLVADRQPSVTPRAERDLRKQIDMSVSRALVDDNYARRLLIDPTVAIEDVGCSPQQFKSLRSIKATDLVDFARQARALFWRVDATPHYMEQQEPLPARSAS